MNTSSHLFSYVNIKLFIIQPLRITPNSLAALKPQELYFDISTVVCGKGSGLW